MTDRSDVDVADLRGIAESLAEENAILRDMLLNPNPEDEPDNVRLHREKCDALEKLWAAQRELADARNRLVKAEGLLAASETALGKALHENAIFRTRLSITDDQSEKSK